MKKAFTTAIIFILTIAACNDSDSGSSDKKGFRLNPETLTVDDKYNSPDTSGSVTFDSSAQNFSYSIIYIGQIGGNDQVGLAFSDNPSAETFSLKIYFQGTALSEGTEINKDNSTIKLDDNGTIYAWDSGSLKFDSVLINEITNDNEKKYTTYTLTISNTATLAASSSNLKDLEFPEAITAIYTGTDD